MSTLKPTIQINPLYTTNNVDPEVAGLYQISPNSSNLALRVNYSNIGLIGEIRLNTSSMPIVFQGYDGSDWVDFNATQGPQGEPGQDFTNMVNFNNLGANVNPSIVVSLGEIFTTTSIDASNGVSNVDIKTLKGGSEIINSNLTINSLVVSQNSNVITLAPQPMPYKWDFSGSNNSVSYLKNINANSQFFSWGETSKWNVKTGVSVIKGQAVRLSNDNVTGNIVIIPVTYNSLPSPGTNAFSTPFMMLGIATNNATGPNPCIVCTKGITTVLCTSNITEDFILSTTIPSTPINCCGVDGIVGKDGGIFYNVNPIVTSSFIKAGYFLETGSNIALNGLYVLFYVDPKIQVV
jgi:hypothetical protein